MKPSEFWVLTYAEFIAMVRGYVKRERVRTDSLLFLAWHMALFERQKELPPFESLISHDDEQGKPKEMTDDQMFAMAKLLNAAFGGDYVEG